MLAGKQTDTQTDKLIAISCCPTGGGVKIPYNGYETNEEVLESC